MLFNGYTNNVLSSGEKKMAVYRSDVDLAFLKQCSDEDLELLVSVLIRDPKDNELRYTETLTVSDEYKRHSPNHSCYWECIAAELQTFGANSIVSLFRGGKGVPYREVLTDACDKMKVNYSKNAAIESIEMCLLMKMLENVLSGMKSEELTEFAKAMDMKLTNPTPELILMTVQSTIKLSGFAAYKFATMSLAYILRLVGMKAPMSVYLVLTQSMRVFSGPIGWTVSGAWLAFDIAAPAYRVTVPACVIVAYLRQKALHAQTT